MSAADRSSERRDEPDGHHPMMPATVNQDALAAPMAPPVKACDLLYLRPENYGGTTWLTLRVTEVNTDHIDCEWLHVKGIRILFNGVRAGEMTVRVRALAFCDDWHRHDDLP